MTIINRDSQAEVDKINLIGSGRAFCHSRHLCHDVLRLHVVVNVPERVELLQNLKHLHAYRNYGLERELSVPLTVEVLEVHVKLCHDHIPEILLFEIAMREESRETYLV